jgi:hypothetical protein
MGERPAMLCVQDVPELMQNKMNWPVSALLMRRWFNGAKYIMTDAQKSGTSQQCFSPQILDTTDVKIDWALRFDRVRKASVTLLHKWRDPKAIELLKTRVQSASPNYSQQPWRFGDLTQPAPVIDGTCQIQFVVFGSLTDPPDDMRGAIGVGTLKLAVSGIVSVQSGARRIAIDMLGIYLRDTYDFNGSQFLGLWNENGLDTSNIDEGLAYLDLSSYRDMPVDRGTDKIYPGVDNITYQVNNRVFNEWREKNDKGGDYFVFSEIKRYPISPPVIIPI